MVIGLPPDPLNGAQRGETQNGEPTLKGAWRECLGLITEKLWGTKAGAEW
jgi:hypothetical protein